MSGYIGLLCIRDILILLPTMSKIIEDLDPSAPMTWLFENPENRPCIEAQKKRIRQCQVLGAGWGPAHDFDLLPVPVKSVIMEFSRHIVDIYRTAQLGYPQLPGFDIVTIPWSPNRTIKCGDLTALVNVLVRLSLSSHEQTRSDPAEIITERALALGQQHRTRLRRRT